MGTGKRLLCEGEHIRNGTGKGRILYLALSQFRSLVFSCISVCFVFVLPFTVTARLNCTKLSKPTPKHPICASIHCMMPQCMAKDRPIAYAT